MKRQNRAGNSSPRLGLALRAFALPLLAALVGLGPAQGAEEAKPTVVVRLSQLNDEIWKLQTGLTATMASLEEVKAVAAKNGQLAAPYAKFSQALESLEAQVAKLRERGTAAKARAKEHWTAWEAELTDMQNPQLREKAQRRYTETVKQFQKIVDRVETAKQTFAPLMANFKDINTYLKTDLSKDAVSSLSGTIDDMSSATRKADSRLADVNEQIQYTIQKMPQKKTATRST